MPQLTRPWGLIDEDRVTHQESPGIMKTNLKMQSIYLNYGTS